MESDPVRDFTTIETTLAGDHNASAPSTRQLTARPRALSPYDPSHKLKTDNPCATAAEVEAHEWRRHTTNPTLRFRPGNRRKSSLYCRPSLRGTLTRQPTRRH